ncbi:hypothetical protein [Brachybacterium squillarum]|uniref:hypothetical protein n=1 Tax=Brachybacterium squillarum TaxID=661979 RepID=UPI001C2FFB9E
MRTVYLERGAYDWIGYPLTYAYASGAGVRQDFQRGFMTYSAANGVQSTIR